MTQQNSEAIAQNNAAIGELCQQLGDSVADLIHTIDYAIDHMEQMISKAFRQGGNGSNPPGE
ncbi:hypothetical protein WKK05_37275 (plasmid) [Nostoc sp. UHCC 0302]|uniref:hypothetical protein n=1 Tax=Nostoc sp. UHCC 0302 TaxID=3134896 RepID=UPI00311CB752